MSRYYKWEVMLLTCLPFNCITCIVLLTHHFLNSFQIVDDVMNNYYQDAIRISIRSITDEDFNKIFEANPELIMRKRGLGTIGNSKTRNLNKYNWHQCYFNPISCPWNFFLDFKKDLTALNHQMTPLGY